MRPRFHATSIAWRMARSNLAGRRAEAVRNAGVQLLGDAAHQFRIIHHHAHSLAQILIALDVRRNADRQKEIRDTLLQRFAAWLAALLAESSSR